MKNFSGIFKINVIGDAADVLSRHLGLPEVPFPPNAAPYDSLGRKAYGTKPVADHINFIAKQSGVSMPTIETYGFTIISGSFQMLIDQLAAANKIPDDLFG